MIKKIFYYILLIIQGVSRIVRDYVIPVINFLQFIKSLLEKPVEGKADPKNTFSKSKLAEILGIAEDVIEKLVSSFVLAIKFLFPELAPAGTAYYNVIQKFVDYLKKLPEGQRTMVIFKVASYMLLHWQKADKKTDVATEHHADMLIQIGYSHLKHTNKLS